MPFDGPDRYWELGEVGRLAAERAEQNAALAVEAEKFLEAYLGHGLPGGFRQRKESTNTWMFYRFDSRRWHGRLDSGEDEGWIVGLRWIGTDKQWRVAPFGNGVSAAQVVAEIERQVSY